MTATGAVYTDHQLVTAGAMTGLPIFERGGDKLGVIKELFINKVTGQIEFLVGASGGFLGVGEKFHPLPWSLLTYNVAPEGYVAQFDREALRQAPAYDKDQLASAHYGWGDQVQRYFSSLSRPPQP